MRTFISLVIVATLLPLHAETEISVEGRGIDIRPLKVGVPLYPTGSSPKFSSYRNNPHAITVIADAMKSSAYATIPVLPNGDYLANCSMRGRCPTFRSSDKGRTWQLVSDPNLKLSFQSLFHHRGKVYLLGKAWFDRNAPDDKRTATLYQSFDFGKTRSKPVYLPFLIAGGHKREGSGSFTSYKKDLESYLAAAVRQVGEEQKVPVIDLHAMSLELYQALGEEGSKRAFVHYPPNTFPNQNHPLKDDTHQLARGIVQGIRQQVPDLAKKLRSPDTTFTPGKPDPTNKITIPTTPGLGEKPEGN